MSAYCDDPKWMRGKIPSGHLVADTLEELHAIAQVAGIRPDWFQPQATVAHYTLLLTHREAAIDAGAIPLDRDTFMRKVHAIHTAGEEARRRASPTRPAKAPPEAKAIDLGISEPQLRLL